MNAVAPIKSTLHHNAYVCKDLEAVRQFYEEVIGFKLVATWAERTDLFGKVDRKSTRLNSSHSQQSRMPSSA